MYTGKLLLRYVSISGAQRPQTRIMANGIWRPRLWHMEIWSLELWDIEIWSQELLDNERGLIPRMKLDGRANDVFPRPNLDFTKLLYACI